MTLDKHKVCGLTIEDIRQIDESLEQFDAQHVTGSLHHLFQLGIKDERGNVIAGLFASGTAYHIVYVSTLFVEEAYRRQGLGKQLMLALEKSAREKDAKFIRLDTFNWQGQAFYRAIGYEEVGTYAGDDFSEHFFLKRL